MPLNNLNSKETVETAKHIKNSLGWIWICSYALCLGGMLYSFAYPQFSFNWKIGTAIWCLFGLNCMGITTYRVLRKKY